LKILVINAHPSQKSLTAKLAQIYAEHSRGVLVHLSDLKFDPILYEGYREIQELEPDLKKIQNAIEKADHLVFVSPVWWGSVPALFKGFLDRVFLPGFAFKYRKGSSLWDKLLIGKTADILLLSDGPSWWNQLVYGDPAVKMLKKAVLEFCGVKVKVTKFGEIKNSTEQSRELMFQKVKKIAIKRLHAIS